MLAGGQQAMENGSNFFPLLMGWRRKKMEQPTGYDLLKTWSIQSCGSEQRVAEVQDWLLSLLCVGSRGLCMQV